MFCGGCAGSTTGGLKIIRLIIVTKVILHEFERSFRPNVVHPIRLGKAVIESDLIRSVFIYVLMIIVLAFGGTFALVLMEPAGSMDVDSAATASIATLMNVGPGFNMVGAVGNYGFFSGGSLMLLSLFMALGRLEVFAILVLLTPRFWVEK
jgi:trk system potassium uptake protein TrkH